MKISWAGAGALILTGPLVAHAQSAVPEVVLEAATGAAPWTVTWRLPAPTTQLTFSRTAGFFRERAWEVVTPGWELAREGDRQVLRAGPDAEPATELVVRTAVYTDPLDKEYEAFQRYSDGGVTVYTGHYLAVPTSPVEAEEVRSVRVRAPDGLRVVIGGTVARAGEGTDGVSWTDPTGAGTYVYIGSGEPVEGSHVVGVIDRGLPEWIRARAESALVELFELYAERTGFELDERPVVLFGWTPSESSGLSSGGGTLPNLIQMGLEGRAWQTETPAAREHLLRFVAHEAVHMWNGQLVRNRVSAQSWIHEGGANALADRALLELGVIDRARVRQHQSRALNECAQGLGGQPLNEAFQRGRTGDFYTCGSTLHLWIEAALDSAGSGADLFDVWSRLIGRALEREERSYDQSDMARVITELGGPPDAAEVLARITDQEHGPSDSALVGMLRSAGLEVRPDPTAADASYKRRMGSTALATLMSGDCNGSVSFYNRDDHAEIADVQGCEVLRPGWQVTELEGAGIYEAGDVAYDRVREGCAAGREVRVGLRGGGEHFVRCSGELPRRVGLWRVGG